MITACSPNSLSVDRFKANQSNIGAFEDNRKKFDYQSFNFSAQH